MFSMKTPVVVVHPHAATEEKVAAKYLQDYLWKIRNGIVRIKETADGIDPHTRGPLSNCIHVGKTLLRARPEGRDAPKLADQEVLLRKTPDALFLAGGGKTGDIYAVWTFLRDYLGCRFLTPDVERLPEKLPERLPERFEVRTRPAFAYRDHLYYFMTPGDWALKNRVNGHFTNLTSLQGGRVGFYPFVHTFSRLVPPSEYYEEHPEYFSLIDGYRSPKQLCLSNPDVQRIAVERVLAWADEHPEFDIFPVDENDHGGYCECEACQRMNGDETAQGGQLFRFANLIARELRRHHPDKYVECLSYSYAKQPPRSFALEPNIIIRLCQEALVCRDPAALERFRREELRRWQDAVRTIFLWYYTHSEDRLMPFLVTKRVQPSMQFYRDKGVQGIFFEDRPCERGGVECTRLRTYVLSQLLWDPDTDVDRHVDDFLAAYYGPGAEVVRSCYDQAYAIYDRLRAEFDDRYRASTQAAPDYGAIFGYQWAQPGSFSNRYMVELERACRPFLDEARRTIDDPTYGPRMDEVLMPFDYFDLFARDPKPRLAANGAWPLYLPPERRERAQAYIERLIPYDGPMNTGQYTHEALQESIARHDVKPIENDRLQALILLESGARMVSLLFKPSGRQLIPCEQNITNFRSTGYEEYATFQYHGPGYREPYTCLEASEETARFRAELANGFALERCYRLDGSALRTETTLINLADMAKTAILRWHARWKCDPVTDTLALQTDEKEAIHTLKDVNEHKERHHLAPAPDGVYRLRLLSQGVLITHAFAPVDIDRFFVVCSSRAGQSVIPDFISAGHTLEPGHAYTWAHSITVQGL